MDVLSQALNVVEQAEANSGRVTLTLDLDEPTQRAAFAAAVAVLRASGVDVSGLTAGQPLGGHAPEAPEAVSTGRAGERSGAGEDDDTPPGEIDQRDLPIWRAYASAMEALTPDKKRRRRILRDTFPRVRDLLHDGANVEAVAQVQYRRWVEERFDATRN